MSPCRCGGRMVPETNRGVEHHICVECNTCDVCDDAPHLERTLYGFRWGAALVTRLASHRGTVVLAVQGSKRTVEVYVSPTGRSVRVYIDGTEVEP